MTPAANRRIWRSPVLIALALLVPGSATAQHFPSDADLTALIQSRVEEERAIGIVLGVMEAYGTHRK